MREGEFGGIRPPPRYSHGVSIDEMVRHVETGSNIERPTPAVCVCIILCRNRIAVVVHPKTHRWHLRVAKVVRDVMVVSGCRSSVGSGGHFWSLDFVVDPAHALPVHHQSGLPGEYPLRPSFSLDSLPLSCSFCHPSQAQSLPSLIRGHPDTNNS